MGIQKRIVLQALSKKELVEWAYEVELPSPASMSKPELIDALLRKRSLHTADILGYLKRDQLKAFCREAGLSVAGRAKQDIIDRLLGGDGAAGGAGTGRGQSGSAKQSGKKSSRGKSMAKKPIEQYEHSDKKRANNPPVGLVTPETDPPPQPDQAKTRYRYDWHLDPELNFDPKAIRDEISDVIDQGLRDDADPEAAPDDGDTAASTLAENALGDDLTKTKAELERTKAALNRARSALSSVKKAQEPYLNWSGKTERTSFEVPTVSLHVHERIDPKSIIEAVKARNGGHEKEQMGLFEQPEQNPRLAHAVEFYKHPHGWSNRLVAGDSLLVMNSLLEKEGMGGKVQMAYFDPPYGVEYRSNFQPFTHQRGVPATDRDQDLTREPEMLRAFRDTWALGLHSYLAYLRDRLLLTRALLADTGSCFVQISDKNVHHAREILDEVFGPSNFVVSIFLRKKGSQRGNRIRPINDYILWYVKDRERATIRTLFTSKLETGDLADSFEYMEMPNGGCVRTNSLNEDEITAALAEGGKAYTPEPLTSGGEYRTQLYPVSIAGRTFKPPSNNCWKFNEEGMNRIKAEGRIHVGRGQIRFKKYHTDFPYKALTNLWSDLAGATGKVYVVQTVEKAVQRCMMMTTDPGDLTLDITCGSGTTPVVAEQFGRRWIACDTSRIALSLAKQRLMTRCFPYYQLRSGAEGIRAGFVYEPLKRITSTTVANDQPPLVEHRFDAPSVDGSRQRVTGPFTLEAVPAIAVNPLTDEDSSSIGGSSVVRSGETLRQAELRTELLSSGARGEGGLVMEFTRVDSMPGAVYLHAEAEVSSSGEFRGRTWAGGDRVAILFGPEHAPLEQRLVEAAWREAAALNPKPKHLLFCAFQFDPEAAKDIDELDPKRIGMTFFRAEMNDDLHTDDLKKKRSSNESFWLIGQPDVALSTVKAGKDKGKIIVEVRGFDYFNLKDGTVDSGGPDKIAMWMLDTDYDDRSLYPRQVFFPMAGQGGGWAPLAKTLKAEIDEDRIEAYQGMKSLPFQPGRHCKVAVKVVDDRGFESLVIRSTSEAD